MQATWQEKLIILLAKAFAKLPLWLIQSIAFITGTLMYYLPFKKKKIILTNIRLCFPKLNDTEQQKLLKQNLRHTFAYMFEIPYFWFGDTRRSLKHIKKVIGESALKEAGKAKHGTIILAPHLGAWELANIYGARHYQTVTLYKPPKSAFQNQFIHGARERLGTLMYPTSARGVRGIYKGLKQGKVACILPDHDPGENGGIFVPFFDVPTHTMTLACQLARKSNIPVFFAYAERLGIGKGFILHIIKGSPGLHDTELKTAVTTMNQQIEDAVRHLPEQYEWIYRRFRRRPPGEPPIY